MKKLAVLMPTYNYSNYITESIESILQQTYKDFDLYIYDDGSTDNTEDVIKSMKDDRIHYVKNQTNIGLPRTLNRGLDELTSKYEYIARMDADDLSLPTRLEKQILFLENNLNVGVCGAQAYCFENETPTKQYHWVYSTEFEKIKIDLLFSATFWHPSVVLRSSILEQFDLRYEVGLESTEDWDFWIKLSNYTKLVNLSDFLMKYRVHKASNHRHSDKLKRHYQERSRIIASYWNQLSKLNGMDNELTGSDIANLYYHKELGLSIDNAALNKLILRLIFQMNAIAQEHVSSIENFAIQLPRILDKHEMSILQKVKLYNMLKYKSKFIFIKRYIKNLI